LWNTLYVFDNDVEAILDGYSLDTLITLLLVLAPQEVPSMLGNFQRLAWQD